MGSSIVLCQTNTSMNKNMSNSNQDVELRGIAKESDKNKNDFLQMCTTPVRDYVEDAQTQFPGHQTDEYYIRNIVRNYGDLDRDSLKIFFGQVEVEKLLSHIKYCDHETNHETMIYWVEHYIEQVCALQQTSDFQSKFLEEQSFNEWFTLNNITSEGNGILRRGIKLTGRVNTEIQKKFDRFNIRGKCANIWYHGTNIPSAESILEIGIDLENGQKKQDFSDGSGFYLTNDFRVAEKWAFKKGSAGNNAAVLVFQSELKYGDDVNELTAFAGSDRTFWENLVKYFRSGKVNNQKETKTTLVDVDYIYGTMSGDGAQYKKQDWNPTPRGDDKQVCIRSNRMANHFTDSLISTIFYTV